MKRGKNLIEEFKKFITRGNVIDMAVGVIIGVLLPQLLLL
ncbi:MscL family protein [Coprobacillaceae bacterium CR2/5/TPMF4]|nr:MscL family protein [Coprobacillaceae bacterium CR2/5/TPMF4]